MGANRYNFKTYINNGTFYIPLYQRDFVWKSEQALGFLNEILELHEEDAENNEERKIFCGSIYLQSNNENYWDVIDGQQRTTFLYGIKWSLQEIVKELLGHIDEFTSRSTKKQIDLFKDIAKSLNSFEIKTARYKKDDSLERQIEKNKGPIINLFKKIKSHIEDYIEKKLDGIHIDIIDFINFIFTRVELVEVKVEDDDDINDIFKSINSKGKTLSSWDIIRNDIYRTSDAGESLLQSIDDQLDIINDDYYIKKEEFIQAILMSETKQYVSKGKMLKIFGEYSQKHQPEDVQTIINKFSNLMTSYDKSNKGNAVNNIKYFFKITKEFNLTQIRIFALSYFLSWGLENEVPKPLKTLLISAIVYMSIGRGRGNVFEKFFQQSNNAKIFLTDKDKLLDKIKASDFYKENILLLNDNEKLKDIDENHSLIKLFIWLETPKSEFGNIMKSLNFEYEHVLPKSFGLWKEDKKYWGDIENVDIEEKYLEKIGNIILIHKTLNAKVKNSVFSEKIKWYLDKEIDGEENLHYIFTRNLSLTKDLKYLKGLYDIQKDTEWTPDLIEERTYKLKLAIIESLKKNI